MTVIAEFSVGSDQFPLGRVLAGASDVRVEVERVVPSSGQVMPYLWVRGGDLDAFERAVRADDRVERLVRLDDVDGRRLYRVEWGEEVRGLAYALAEFDATVLEATGNGGWFFRVRFDDRARVAEVTEFLRDRGIEVVTTRLYALADADEVDGDGASFGLTDTQRRVVTLAVEEGYFEVPRRTTLGDVAGTLGVTEQAVSETLRRGVDAVLRRTLAQLESAAGDDEAADGDDDGG
ncbi:bacterio-opsin activator domain-containing protein [Halobaculum sp. EA56]|uniref:helix-turn-helix domain-containing protein n=1 Tax=Halobaculum sp. EA56 TaxID=3421648 RepID=UPI003EBD615C